MANKLSLELEVVDKGKIKLKQFADESKKAFDDLLGSAKDLTSASANLQAQYEKLTSSFRIKRAFEELVGSVEKVEEASAAAAMGLLKFIYDLARWASTIAGLAQGLYSLRNKLSTMKEGAESARDLNEQMKKLEDRFASLKAPGRVLEFLKEEQTAARELAQRLNIIYDLQDKIATLRETIDQRRAGGLPVFEEREELRGYSEKLREAILEISALYGSLEDAEGKLAQHNRNIVEAALLYDELTSGVKGSALAFDELGKAIDKAQPDKEAFERIRRAWEEAESKAAEATIELARAQAEHNWQLEQYINAFKERQTLKEIEHMVLLAETTGEAAAAYRGIEENLNRLNQKGRESINIFAAMLDLMGSLSNLMSQLGISIGGFFEVSWQRLGNQAIHQGAGSNTRGRGNAGKAPMALFRSAAGALRTMADARLMQGPLCNSH